MTAAIAMIFFMLMSPGLVVPGLDPRVLNLCRLWGAAGVPVRQ
jgi:hypothetical protein